MTRATLLLCLLAVICCLPGCSSPRIELAVASQPNVNPDYTGRPSPVIVKMYELRNNVAFNQADFQTLFTKPIEVLSADLVAADELVFIPGEARKVNYKPNPETRFIGVVAGFRNMDRAQWRTIKPIDPEKENLLAIELNDAAIVVIPEERAEDWEPETAVKNYQQRLAQPQSNTPQTGTEPVGVNQAQPVPVPPESPKPALPAGAPTPQLSAPQPAGAPSPQPVPQPAGQPLPAMQPL